MLVRCEGIVLRAIDYGESSKIITVYTKEMGKVSLMAKGVKKYNNALYLATTPLHYGEYEFFMKKGMGTIRRVETLKHFSKLYQDIILNAYALYIAELVDRGSEEKVADEVIYSLLLHMFEQLDNGIDADILLNIFEIQILSLYGVEAHFGTCRFCSVKSSAMWFSIQLGGVLCVNCRHRDNTSYILNETVHKLLYLFSRVDINKIGTITVSSSAKKEIRNLLDRYYEQNVGIKFKVKRFIEQMNRLEQVIINKEK